MWAVRSLGINPSDGRELFLTKEGTYTFEYDTEDEVVVGNSEPKLEGVLGSTLYWKGFRSRFISDIAWGQMCLRRLLIIKWRIFRWLA